MSEIDNRVTRKVQIEEQQQPRIADFRDAQWQQIVYPGGSTFSKPVRSASIFEIIAAVLLGIGGVVFMLRLFFVPDESRTMIDRIGIVLVTVLMTALCIALSIALIARALRYIQESKLYKLPNGFPVSLNTINRGYAGLSDIILDQPGYFTVEQTRAKNPIVAPGEISTTFSPA